MRGLRMPPLGRVPGQAKDVTRSMSALHHPAAPVTFPFPRTSKREPFSPCPSTKSGERVLASQRVRARFRRAAVLLCVAILASGCGRRGGLSQEGQAARADGPAGTALRAVALRAEIDANDSTLIAAAERAISKGMGPLRSIQAVTAASSTTMPAARSARASARSRASRAIRRCRKAVASSCSASGAWSGMVCL